LYCTAALLFLRAAGGVALCVRLGIAHFFAGAASLFFASAEALPQRWAASLFFAWAASPGLCPNPGKKMPLAEGKAPRVAVWAFPKPRQKKAVAKGGRQKKPNGAKLKKILLKVF